MSNKQVRDTVFRDYFNNKERLLSLGNALLHTDYKSPEDVEINTLEGTFFSNIKNDISFMLGGHWLVLVEHQTTINRNMPFRMLLYICELYKRYGTAIKQRRYGAKVMKLPRPEFYVFYDGMDADFTNCQLRLSDAFDLAGREPKLELIVNCFNLNAGCSEALKEQCTFLEQYSWFSNSYKQNIKNGMDIDNAIRKTIKDAIDSNVMKDYLKKRTEEVVDMFGFEWNEDEYKEVVREEAYEDGHEAGLKAGHEAGLKAGLEAGLEAGRREGEVRMALSMLRKGRITEAEAAEEAGMNVIDFRKAVADMALA